MKGHVVIAPDKFRGSLTSPEVVAHVTAGLGRVPVVGLPVADGGEGTVDAVVASGFTRVEVEVTGPTGDPVVASYAVRDEPHGTTAAEPVTDVAASPRSVGRVAVIELAEASGLRRLPGAPAPLTATSYGTGELIAHAVRHGATRIVLGLGGSACTDGGAGMVQALGARLLGEDGEELPFGGAALGRLDRIDASALAQPAPGDPAVGGTGVGGVEFVVASDVDNPLLGPNGAAAVYGPQKGASPQDVAILEKGLARLAAVAVHTHGLTGSIEHDGVVRSMGVAGRPGAGAAGGVGFAALAFLRAEIRPGIGYLLELLDFDRQVEGARLVITGEGSIDEQSLRGKAPVGVASAAAKHGVPVVAVCGRRSIGDAELRSAGIEAAYALTDIEPDVKRCIAEAGPLLERVARTIAATHLP
ncbi:glycerate kinase [Planotetraspora phitsanulokensis]|uniref:Glycerate kinase n=1 Tax=Planotetraspora phitsanulokensis TaxID=575192 RepID=A0A8J3U1Y3_9ACTN|nr:glycerate kinase [Planotetraspora phitsanulokensis]GII36745.1 glycerate kinase [Planotetraspora phitsanulokensis]